jgi:hypothetical protein
MSLIEKTGQSGKPEPRKQENGRANIGRIRRILFVSRSDGRRADGEPGLASAGSLRSSPRILEQWGIAGD